jgi:hypothetical protein
LIRETANPASIKQFMACRAVHFAITEEEARNLRSFKEDGERLAYLQEQIEETYFTEQPERKAETDKAWDAIHRCLTDGKLGYDNGSFPLSHVILGGEPIYTDDDYIMVLKTPQEVKQIARSAASINERFTSSFRLPTQREPVAWHFARASAGSSIAARMAMIAITTRSSMSVKVRGDFELRRHRSSVASTTVFITKIGPHARSEPFHPLPANFGYHSMKATTAGIERSFYTAQSGSRKGPLRRGAKYIK